MSACALAFTETLAALQKDYDEVHIIFVSADLLAAVLTTLLVLDKLSILLHCFCWCTCLDKPQMDIFCTGNGSRHYKVTTRHVCMWVSDQC